MADNSKIEWTEATWNPIRGCTRVSDGCRNCYAERVAMRFSGKGKPYEGLVKITNGHPQWTGNVAFAEEHLADPLRWKEPRRIFVNSMSDLFHEGVPFEFIDKVYGIIGLAQRHTFQILTKRPERAKEYFESRSQKWATEHFIELPGKSAAGDWVRRGIERAHNGVSVENQPTADSRIPIMLQWQTGPAVRWISAEPLLAPIKLNTYAAAHTPGPQTTGVLPPIDWCVVGGESGPGARPMDPDWARSLRDQCKAAAVPFFFKQHGEHIEVHQNTVNRGDIVSAHGKTFQRIGKKAAGRLLDGREHNEYPEVAHVR